MYCVYQSTTSLASLHLCLMMFWYTEFPTLIVLKRNQTCVSLLVELASNQDRECKQKTAAVLQQIQNTPSHQPFYCLRNMPSELPVGRLFLFKTTTAIKLQLKNELNN